MNIKQAKEQIQYAISAYLTKNEFGEPEIPVERQRPIFLMGPPGIGKTAIMKQIAQDLNIGLVAYSMTHHTRQSALGLPFIVHKRYRGQEYDVSEYTMSEIIASVYDCIEQNGAENGILFLDEINCVSETLAPSMLQFLQYKTFGRHRVPDGWVVVTAGNPPEYNDSVREFEIVTWDRLKRIDVEADFDVWKEYALEHGVHPAALTYLEIKKDDFYKVETTVDGKQFVTARGWEDLSDIIKIYERKGYVVNEQLIRQYLQNPIIAKSFAVYYDLFKKYRSDYQVDTILEGNASDIILKRAMKAKFDERLSLLGLFMEALTNDFKNIAIAEDMMAVLMNDIRKMKDDFARISGTETAEMLMVQSAKLDAKIRMGLGGHSMSEDTAYANRRASAVMQSMAKAIRADGAETGKDAFALIKKLFNAENSKLKANAALLRSKIDNIFSFCEKAFSEGREILILVTELTTLPSAARFISRYGSDAYFRNNKNLLFYERKTEILQKIEELDLED